MKVIKYTTTCGDWIKLTPEQARKIEESGVTLRGRKGDPYCQVSLGLHEGVSTWSEAELEEILADRTK